MPGGLAIVYSDEYTKICIVPKDLCTIWISKFKYFKQYIESSDLISHALLIKASSLKDESLLEVAHNRDYINLIKRLSESGAEGFLDLGDTRYYPKIYDDLLLLVGGSIKAADMVAQGFTAHSYNPYGGFHHAHRNRASGFCIFNDVAITAKYLQKYYGYDSIAIVDFDVHHADGTQSIFYEDASVLTISIHAFGDFFYPGTGDVSETGAGRGKGYTVNIPLPLGSGDDTFKNVMNVVRHIVEAFSPDVILVQAGVDGLNEDLLGRLRLTFNSYMYAGKTLHELSHTICNGRLVAFGGGGYCGVLSAKAMLAFIYELSKPMRKHIELKIQNILSVVEETKSSSEHIHKVDAIIREIKERVKWVKWG